MSSNEEVEGIIVVPQIKVYKGNYRPEFRTKVLNHLKTGKSITSFAGSIGVTPTTITKWIEEYPAFAEAVDIARSINLGTLEDHAINQVTGDSKGSSAMLTFLMKNQHSDIYKDKQVIESEGNVSFIIDTGIPRRPKEVENQPLEADFVEVINDEDCL